ncbi:MAG: helicase RepA family protein [Planctomycetia bacterium]|nr:helicase RepA family protein [Planctomycetia bacterium]
MNKFNVRYITKIAQDMLLAGTPAVSDEYDTIQLLVTYSDGDVTRYLIPKNSDDTGGIETATSQCNIMFLQNKEMGKCAPMLEMSFLNRKNKIDKLQNEYPNINIREVGTGTLPEELTASDEEIDRQLAEAEEANAKEMVRQYEEDMARTKALRKRDCLDIFTAFTEEPEPLDFVIPGLLAGTIGNLVAPGATGKSFLCLELAASIACEVAGGDLLKLGIGKAGDVLYIAAEDPIVILKHRLHAIGQHFGMEVRRSIDQHLYIYPAMGTNGLDIANEDTTSLNKIIDLGRNVRLIIVDTISKVHHVDENSNSDMSFLLRQLEIIAEKTGAAILFLHHVSKASGREGADDQYASRGAGSLTDNSRFGAALTKVVGTEKYEIKSPLSGSVTTLNASDDGRFVCLSVPKNNYAEPIKKLFFERAKGGVLLRVDDMELKDKAKAKGQGGFSKVEITLVGAAIAAGGAIRQPQSTAGINDVGSFQMTQPHMNGDEDELDQLMGL